MALNLRAIYENGHLRLLDPVTLREGEEVGIKLLNIDEELTENMPNRADVEASQSESEENK